MYELRGTLTGVAPILFNRFINPAALDGPRGTNIKADRDKLIALKCFQDERGLYLPASNLKNAIAGTQGSRGAATIVGSEIEKNRGGKYINWCRACLFIQPDQLYFGKDVPDGVRTGHSDWRYVKTWDDVDGRVAKNWNAKGAAIWVERPYLNVGWKLPFSVQVVDDNAKPEWVKRFFEVAGLRVGIGSFRPDFGRFLVEWA